MSILFSDEGKNNSLSLNMVLKRESDGSQWEGTIGMEDCPHQNEREREEEATLEWGGLTPPIYYLYRVSLGNEEDGSIKGR